MKASIALADDHVQFRSGLANLLKELACSRTSWQILFYIGEDTVKTRV